MTNQFKIIAVIVGFSVLGACRGSEGSISKDRVKEHESSESAESIFKDIKLLIADLTCESDSECKVVEMGFRPCGGPASFESYSTRHVDEAKLAEKAAALYHAEKLAQSDTASICSLVELRAPRCVNISTEAPRCMVLPGAPIAKKEQILQWTP